MLWEDSTSVLEVELTSVVKYVVVERGLCRSVVVTGWSVIKVSHSTYMKNLDTLFDDKRVGWCDHLKTYCGSRSEITMIHMTFPDYNELS